MKFFDFDNGFPYCALICAVSEQEALECYQEQVSDIEDAESHPEEITEEEAREEYLGHCENKEREVQALKEFNEYINDSEPTVLLIDSCLI